MDIGAVVRALRNGGRIRRSTWYDLLWLELDRGRVLVMPEGHIWEPEDLDLLANDWELTT